MSMISSVIAMSAPIILKIDTVDLTMLTWQSHRTCPRIIRGLREIESSPRSMTRLRICNIRAISPKEE